MELWDVVNNYHHIIPKIMTTREKKWIKQTIDILVLIMINALRIQEQKIFLIMA